MLRAHVIFCHWPAQQRPVANGSCEVKSGGLARTVENQHSKGRVRPEAEDQLVKRPSLKQSFHGAEPLLDCQQEEGRRT
jgi:hypothetical protein